METILLVDDEKEILRDRSRIIRDLGYRCLNAGSGKEAIRILKRDHPDIILTDQKMPNQDGFNVLEATMEIEPAIPVILFTGYGTIESAVHAMKLGAYDYIQKPFSPEMMEIVLKKAIDYRKMKKENLSLRAQVEDMQQLDNLVYRSTIMKQLAKNVLKLAKSDANVLIFDESGTGKELIARSIHRFSARKDKPFIPLDCVALPFTLIESELFGFEKGAFTGAINSKPGMFELAEEGSLFLDEIVELDLALQAKLLRVLQERHFRRIGGEKLTAVNVRIISATNWNPEKAVKEKRLREDLYFRLNVIPLYVPPLRDRKEDIPLLVHHFIDKYNPFSPREIKGIDGETMRCLNKYNWPGNVRELENIVQRVMSMTDHDIIQLEDIPKDMISPINEQLEASLGDMNYKEAKGKYLEQFTKQYLGDLIKKCDGNIAKTARKAGMSRKTIYRMMENYSLKP